MECRKFEITLISANNLENIRKFLKMKVYARVSISGTGGGGGGGGPDTEKWTPVDHHGEVNPAWNFTMRYTICESTIENFNSMLVVKLYCRRSLKVDRYIGEVHTSMKELFECARASGGSACLSFPVMKGCVNSQGGLKFSYSFGEKVNIDKLLLAESLAAWSLS